MLILRRAVDQQIFIGDNIVLTITGIKSGSVQIGIEAPRDVRVIRGEIRDTPTNPHQIEGATTR